MEANIARNIYKDQYRKILSYPEFVAYLRKGIDLIMHSATFPSDTEGMQSIRIANDYRNKLRQSHPSGYEAFL